jgi:hypothetical protein
MTENKNVEFLVMMGKEDILNQHPDKIKMDHVEKIKVADFIEPNYEFEKRRFSVFAISFSNIKVPIIRRAIEDKAKWCDEGTYEEQTDLLEMEYYLKKFVKKDLAQHIRKRLHEGNFKVLIKINS